MSIGGSCFTDCLSLEEARQWCIAVLATCSLPPITFGAPCVVNPMIVGATKRKNDVLDAKPLALQNLTGIWAESYIPIRSVQEVRLLLAESFNDKKHSNRTSNQINNVLPRFGYNIGRNNSATKSKTVRAIAEDQVSDSPPADYGNLCLLGIPNDVHPAFRDGYEQYAAIFLRNTRS